MNNKFIKAALFSGALMTLAPFGVTSSAIAGESTDITLEQALAVVSAARAKA